MRYLLIITVLLAGCAGFVEKDALVEFPGKYEDNSIFIEQDGQTVECRKDINRPMNPYHLVKGKPTNCRPSGDWPDGGVTR